MIWRAKSDVAQSSLFLRCGFKILKVLKGPWKIWHEKRISNSSPSRFSDYNFYVTNNSIFLGLGVLRWLFGFEIKVFDSRWLHEIYKRHEFFLCPMVMKGKNPGHDLMCLMSVEGFFRALCTKRIVTGLFFENSISSNFSISFILWICCKN